MPASAHRVVSVVTARVRRRARTAGWRRNVMRSPSHFAKDILREELLEAHGRFDLADAPAGRDDLLRSARADPHELLADQTLGLDGGDGVLLKLHVPIEAQHHARL